MSMLDILKRHEESLLEKRAALKADIDKIADSVESEKRSALTEAEQSKFDEIRGDIAKVDAELVEQRKRIADAEEDAAREARSAAARVETGAAGVEERASVAPARVTSEPETYRKGGEASYFRDLVSVSLMRGDAREAQERLVRNNREVQVETRALSTTDSAGGDFVPPLWMVNDAVMLARAARPVADRVRNAALPTGTDSVNVPKILTGTAVAEQATQNSAVQNTDATTSSVTANVATLAGQQVVSVQLIEQSPTNLDQILLQDLAADYAAKVDLFVLNNNATGKKGLLQEAGTNAVTYTSASPTVALRRVPTTASRSPTAPPLVRVPSAPSRAST